MILKFLKPFSFLPAILLMYIIFSFSAQDGATSADLSYQVSHKIVEVGGEVLGADLQPWEIDQLAMRFHIPVRKLAHMTEYFLLAIAVAFPLYVYGLRGILLLLSAGAICVAFACGDEYHQSYVAGRGPSKRDVLIDSVGVFLGIVLVRIIGWTGRNTIFRPFAKKKKEARYDARPQADAGPYYERANYSDPYSDPRGNPYNSPYGDPYSNPYNDPYSNPYSDPYDDPYSSPYSSPYGDPYPEEEPSGTSDRLSEDMSLRKLVSDLKDQKKNRRDAGSRKA